jgi:ornithine carrier protein
MPVIGATAENATLFLVYNRAQAVIRRLNPSEPLLPGELPPPMSLPQLAAAAGCAGAVASFVLTPIELVKCRMQVQLMNKGPVAAAAASSSPSLPSSSTARTYAPSASSSVASNNSSSPVRAAQTSRFSTKVSTPPSPPGPFAIVANTVRTHGFSGLWLGQTGTLLRETGGSMAWFMAFEALSRGFVRRRQETAPEGVRIVKSDLPAWQLMASGACAGISYNVILYPADSIKSTIQTEDELRSGDPKHKATASARPRRGFLEVGRDIYRNRGIKGLYNGCGLTCMRSAPSSAMIFLIYS